ncbi:MFS transporter [Gorillibacterium timonense]|uniref:MFS transporter n=1 Tax=Gorillibacterium timonense TaxID=1689269 RepID=UPI00071C97A3|nr:MFS transporter [Gorillibacterium timonense]
MATWFLVVIYLAFISLGLPDSLLGSAWPVMRLDLGARLDSAGILSMIVSGGTILSSLASGAVVRRLGTGRVTLISCILTAGALLGFSQSPSFVWLALLAIPLGLGAGAVDAGLNQYVAEHYKAHHMNWLHCFWGVGATMGPILMSASLTGPHSWRGGYATVSILQFALVFVLFVTLPLWNRVAASREGSGSTNESPGELIEPSGQVNGNILRLRGVKPSLAAFLLYCGAESTLGLWGASYLVGARQVAAETAAGWVSLYYGGITLGRFITGFLTFKIPNKSLIRYGQLVAIAGGILLLLPLPAAASLIGILLIGLGLAPIYPGLLHETPSRFGRANSAKLMGVQMAVAYVGSTFLPPLFGVLAARTSMTFFPYVVLAFLALMLLSAERVNRILVERIDHEKGRTRG